MHFRVRALLRARKEIVIDLSTTTTPVGSTNCSSTSVRCDKIVQQRTNVQLSPECGSYKKESLFLSFYYLAARQNHASVTSPVRCCGAAQLRKLTAIKLILVQICIVHCIALQTARNHQSDLFRCFESPRAIYRKLCKKERKNAYRT